MQRALAAVLGMVLVAGVATLAQPPGPAGAQGGGTIEVTVRYSGPPVVETLTVTSDTEKCGPDARIERVVVGANRGLANAVVSVAGATGTPPAKKAVIAQRGCRFDPHVVAMMPGELEIRNADDILHTVHTDASANPAINRAQPKFKKVMTERLEKPEIIRLTCDVHPWMVAWIAVMSHPFFGVTDGRGATKIEHVPAGTHTLEVWHETLGKRTQEVEVKAGQVVKVSIEMTR